MTDDRHLTVHVEAGSMTLSQMSTEDLRAELRATLTVTARHLMHLASVWRELERRGEDLTGLRSGLWSYMAMIAQEDLRPEIVVRYAGSTALLKRLARLSLADQDRLLADDRVTVVELTDAGAQERVVSLARLKSHQISQVIRDRIVSPDDQRRALTGARIEVAAPAPRSILDKAISHAKARPSRAPGRATRPVGLSLSDQEWGALQGQADAAGLPVAKLVAGALAFAGLLQNN